MSTRKLRAARVPGKPHRRRHPSARLEALIRDIVRDELAALGVGHLAGLAEEFVDRLREERAE